MEWNILKGAMNTMGDERDVTIGRQRRKIYNIEKRLKVSEKWVKVLIWIICFLGLINIIFVTMLLKIP